MPVVLLNHDFVSGMAHRTDLDPVMVGLADTQRRLGAEPLHVHPELHSQDTGQGPFIAWANHERANPDRRPLVELLLRLCDGPFVTDLAIDEHPAPDDADPALPATPEWRKEAVLHLGHHALSAPQVRPWVLSYDPQSQLCDPNYRIIRGNEYAVVENFCNASTATSRLAILATEGLHDTLSVLEAAGRHCDRIVVLDKAKDSARRWTLDCTEQTLSQALVSLEVYGTALDQGLSRELAAERYFQACSVPMSQESSEVWKNPTCRMQRQIDVPARGKQYFDMHAKPGGRTRIHIWTEQSDGRTRIYVGHCGNHLLLPGKKR